LKLIKTPKPSSENLCTLQDDDTALKQKLDLLQRKSVNAGIDNKILCTKNNKQRTRSNNE